MISIPVIRVAAAHMKTNADAFRSDFVNGYLLPEQPYPIERALRATRLRPESMAAKKLLLARGNLVVRGGVVSNDVGIEVEADFSPVINDKAFTVSALFPKPLSVHVAQTADTLTFTIDTPIDIVFVTLPAIPEADSLPRRTQLRMVEITPSGLTYTFGEPNGAAAFLLVADFLLTGMRDDPTWRRLLRAHGPSSVDQSPFQFVVSATSQCGYGDSGPSGNPSPPGCTKCSCPNWRSDSGDPELCINIQPPTNKLCQHTRADHNM